MGKLFWISTSSTDPSVGANWSTGSAPANGDDVFIVPVAGLALANIAYKDMSTVTLNSLTISAAIAIGTTDATSGNFYGYWKIGATTWTINGPVKRVKINFGSVQYAGIVQQTGQSIDSGAATVRVLGTHASNTLDVSGGSSVGVATNLPGETSTVLTANVTDPQSDLEFGPGVTWTAVSAGTQATIDAASATAGSGPGTTITSADGAVATLTAGNLTTANCTGGTIALSNRPASGHVASAVNISNGGILDLSGSPDAGTIPAVSFGKGSILLPVANPDAVVIATLTPTGCKRLTAA